MFILPFTNLRAHSVGLWRFQGRSSPGDVTISHGRLDNVPLSVQNQFVGISNTVTELNVNGGRMSTVYMVYALVGVGDFSKTLVSVDSRFGVDRT